MAGTYHAKPFRACMHASPSTIFAFPSGSVDCTRNSTLFLRAAAFRGHQAKEEKEKKAEEEIEKEEKEQIRVVGEKLLSRLVGRALGRVSDEAFATECRDWADHLCRAPGGLDLVKMSRSDARTLAHLAPPAFLPFCNMALFP